MPPLSSPTVRRQRLGAQLRQLREAAGLTGEQVIARIGWAAKSKLSRLENGRSRPDLADVLDLLDLYQIRGPEREQLVAIARDAGNTRGWLRAYPVMTQTQRGYAELEAGSVSIQEYGASIVPGLLQSAEYARVRILSTQTAWQASPASSHVPAPRRHHAGSTGAPQSAMDLEAEVAARMARQAILRREADPPAYEAVIDEHALTGRAASQDVVAGQLAHLASLATLPNVTIRVLPCCAVIGPEFLPYTGFSIYHFSDPGDPETVAVDTLARELRLIDHQSVARYRIVFRWLTAAALKPADSRLWIEKRLQAADR